MVVPSVRGATGYFVSTPDTLPAGSPQSAFVDTLPAGSPQSAFVGTPPVPSEASSEASSPLGPSCPSSRRSSLSVHDCCDTGDKRDRRAVRTPEGIVMQTYPSSSITAAHIRPDGILLFTTLATAKNTVTIQDLSQKEDLSVGTPSASVPNTTPDLPVLSSRPLLEKIVAADGTVLAEPNGNRYECIYPQMIGHTIVAACYGNGKLYCATDKQKVFEIPDGKPEELKIITLSSRDPPGSISVPYGNILAMNLVTYAPLPRGETIPGEPVNRLVVMALNHIGVIPVKI